MRSGRSHCTRKSPEMGATVDDLAVGQTWRENDDRYHIAGASPYRHVKVLDIDGERVQIIGLAPYPTRKTWTHRARFGDAGKTGFTLANPVLAQVPGNG